MKRKVLAIALSLALLTSLFVFAAPVIAKPDNAAPQAGFIDFEINLVGPVGMDVTDYYDIWIGTPREFEGKATLGTIREQGAFSLVYNASGTFGDGTAVLYVDYFQDNFASGTRTTKGTWEITFNDLHNGKITCSRLTNEKWAAWTPTSTDPWRSAWDSGPIHWGTIEGTGDFENFRFSTSVTGAGGGLVIFGTGHYSP